MYLSLKGSLGHTAITDRVGESLLQIAEGSSAAYSLRNLGSDSPSVVRVRRESDNAERDFTAQDINTSVVENWVNQQIIPPLDLRELTPTGRDGPLIPAAAAYSLRNLSNSYTGNVVEVRRASDDQVRSFTAVEVSNGTLLAWVNADIDKLDLQPESGGLTGNVTNETATGFDFSVNNEGSTGFKFLLPGGNAGNGSYDITFDTQLNSGSLTGCFIANNNLPDSFDQQALASGSNTFTAIVTVGTRSSYYRTIYFRTEDTAVADVSITNITLTQTTADGHVTTWYDQSGNTNHATQATPASQPKIVDAGVLVAGGIDFDGVDDWIKATGAGAFKSSDGLGFFSVYNKRNASTSDSFTGENPQYLVQVRDVNLSTTTFAARILGGKMNTIRATVAGSGTFYSTTAATHTIGIDRTLSSITGAQSVDLYNDGSELTLSVDESGLTYEVPDATILVGTQDGSIRFFNGTLSEVIIYNSDQSDNRTAFESNIGEVYGIAGIPAYDNTVNGFVETWYDQSGNGNNASQLTASQQPKIVDTGVLVTDRDGKVALNGKGASLALPGNAPMLSADGTYSVFAVVDFDDQRNGNEDFDGILNFESKTTGGSSSFRKPYIYSGKNDGTLRLSSYSFPDGTAVLTNSETLSVQLLTNIANPALSTGNNIGYADGVLVTSSNTNTDVNTETLTSVNAYLFDADETTVTNFLSEVIYYPSDESAKRAAIENNIDNHYGITSAGSYVNAAGDSYINAAGDTYLQP